MRRVGRHVGFSFELTASDVAMARHLQEQDMKSHMKVPVTVRALQILTGLGILVGALVSLAILTSSFAHAIYLPLAISGFVAACAYSLSVKIYSKAYYKHYRELLWDFPIRVDLTLSDEGILTATDNGDTLLRWPSFVSVQDVPARIALMMKNYQVLVVPNSAFDDEPQREEFLRQVRSHIAAND